MAEPQDVFDPGLYERVRLPLLRAETLPPWCYTSERFYQGEVERIFRRSWNFVGREDEIATPGDYLVFDLVGESVIVARDLAGTIRAFANSCRHRGTRLLSGKGSCKAIACPYHSWVYRLDGALIGSAGMEQTLGFDRAEYGLVPVRIESWAGFLFVNFDEAALPLAAQLGDLPARFAAYNLGEMVCTRRKEYDLACNWKIYLENAMEEYHTPTVHRKSIGAQRMSVEEDGRGDWHAMHMPAEKTIAVLAEDLPSAFPPIAGLAGKPASGTFFTALYPATFLALTQDCMWWLQEAPLGPQRTRVSAGACFPRSTAERPDFAEKVEKYYRRWDKSLPEDNAISELQQAGLAQSLSRAGRLSWHEPVVHLIANWVLDRVLGRAPQSPAG